MPLPILNIGFIKSRTVLKERPESLLAIIAYELTDGQIVHELAPKTYVHEQGQKIGYYQCRFVDGFSLKTIIRL